ncbi:MAG: 2Fe-2S iron-sulfur cluster-binding protein [Candidatus Binatia bacterium]
MNDARLPPQSAPADDAAERLTFSFAGKQMTARAGDTIGAALYAAGVRIFSRSFKYHRPRGALCFSGKCPNCLMNVDGTPNVRTCVEPVRPGMRVRPQNAWPSVERDAFSVLDKMDRLLPIGFYYKTFIRPRFIWPLVEQVLRRVAGLGEVDHALARSERYEHEYRHADVAVVGGGPAGLSAAREAAALGARVALVDDQPALGGHLRMQARLYANAGEHSGTSGVVIAGALRAVVESLPGVDVLRPATVFGSYEGGLLGVVQGQRLIHLRAKRLVVATGCYEYPPLFHNNDLPGVMLGSGAQRLLQLYGVRPGTRAVVVTNSDFGLAVACDLLAAGVEIAAVADARLAVPERELQQLAAGGVSVLAGYGIEAAWGRKRVEGARLMPLDATGQAVPGERRAVPCDLICVSTGFAPATALLAQSGGRLGYDAGLGAIVPQQLPPTVFAAGEVSGIHHLPTILLQGKVAGLRAALSLQLGDGAAGERCAEYERQLAVAQREYRAPSVPFPVVGAAAERGKKFVCVCEDVTEKDLCAGIAEGFDEIELLKRYSTVSMGPCQGKMCAMTSVRVCARETGRTMDEIGTTTARPPVVPVALGVLAGRSHHPVKRTPMHHKHVALGAEMMDLGGWQRPYAYRAPAEEHAAVRERAGLIDVSTLGKLDVKGADAGRLLDTVYTHSFSGLRVGRVRYGILCDDSGVILDDGTVSRLADDHFFITTTTGNIDFVEQWLKWWAAGTGLCVHVTNVTAGWAAMNLAGPRAREVLATLTARDLSGQAFPYLACARDAVAGVPALLLRIGFVGETGWEIHVPAEYGEHVWDAVMAAGKPFDIAPFGVEAQRILRLEKKHLIVGQDTDALSNPLEADIAWVVKFDKADFIGKRALESIRERGLRQKLVGFALRDGTAVEAGGAVALDGKLVGRVASARVSPYTGKCIGLAWVPADVAASGAAFHIRVNGATAVADVVDAPFYDPEGNRLKS